MCWYEYVIEMRKNRLGSRNARLLSRERNKMGLCTWAMQFCINIRRSNREVSVHDWFLRSFVLSSSPLKTSSSKHLKLLFNKIHNLYHFYQTSTVQLNMPSRGWNQERYQEVCCSISQPIKRSFSQLICPYSTLWLDISTPSSLYID